MLTISFKCQLSVFSLRAHYFPPEITLTMPKLYFRPKPISIVSDSVKYVAICSSYGDVLLWYTGRMRYH